MCLLCLLTPPYIPPEPYPLIARLPCAHLKNRPQCHPLCHRPLSSSNVDHFRLGSCRFPHYFLPGSHPHPFFLPSLPLPRDLPHKPSVCPLHRPLHCRQNYPSLQAKEYHSLPLICIMTTMFTKTLSSDVCE